jgi:hypothetical protein
VPPEGWVGWRVDLGDALGGERVGDGRLGLDLDHALLHRGRAEGVLDRDELVVVLPDPGQVELGGLGEGVDLLGGRVAGGPRGSSPSSSRWAGVLRKSRPRTGSSSQARGTRCFRLVVSE